MANPERLIIRAPSTGRGGALLPVLPAGTGPLDPVAIATWHLALSDAVRPDLPHELLALWLFPDAGGVILLGPEALAEDRIPLERPAPFLSQEQLLALEERVRAAGYASVIATPVRDRDRDLGLLLLAALAAGQYGPIQAMRLFEVLRHLTEPFRELAHRAPPIADGLSLAAAPDLDSLLQRVARVATGARSGTELITRLSAAIHGVTPHDELLILVPAPAGGWQWLGLEEGVRRWRGVGAEPGDGPRGMEALEERLAGQQGLAVRDLTAERGGLAWPAPPGRAGAQRIRALLAATLVAGGQTSGYLLLGSVAADLYRPADEARIGALAGLLGPAVAALTLREEAEALRRTVTALEGPGGALAKVVRRLATVPRLGEATRQVEAALLDLTGATRVRFQLRLGGDDAVELSPGEVQPILDLPLLPIAGLRTAPVLRGEVPLLLLPDGEVEHLALPLRIAGRPFGVLLLTGPAGGRLASTTLAAQQVADATAAHLELLRREAGMEAGSGR